MYFQQQEGPFADDDYRTAFSMSIDRQALFEQIYAPIFESAGAEGQLLNCGPIVEGPFCPTGLYENTYDQAAADKVLTDAGWEKNGDGLWAKDGTVPQVRWLVNAGNSRRESTQAFLIPLLREAGFDVIADNCDSDCMFQQRVPTLDYDLGMYINTAAAGSGVPDDELRLRPDPDRGEQQPRAATPPAGATRRRPSRCTTRTPRSTRRPARS